MRIVKWGIAVWLTCIVAVFVAADVGHQQPPPREAAMLHLNECRPPCWIGIVPNITTVADALKRIGQVYGSNPDYTLTYLDMPNAGAFVVDKKSGRRLQITLNLWGTDWNQSQPLVDNIAFYFDSTRLYPPLQLGDLNALLGSPNEVISYREEPWLILLYQTGRIHVFVPNRACNKADMSQEVLDFMFYGRAPTHSDFYWLENPMPWRGFNTCHHLDSSAP